MNVGVLRDVDSDELADELENVCSDNDGNCPFAYSQFSPTPNHIV